MNQIETGKAIAILRKKAGYTQATLAAALDISDKAVSKWERGIASPDISLLPRLSVLLDTDIESILRGAARIRGHNRWKGILILDDLAMVPIYSKPLVYFLLSNFLLVGIREILINGGEVENELGTGERYGLQLTYSNKSLGLALSTGFASSSVMIVYGNVLVYGAHLTRRYQSLMSLKDGANNLQTYSGNAVPIMFCTEERWKQAVYMTLGWESSADMVCGLSPEYKPFVRGVTCLPLNDADQILQAANFVKIIENAGKETMADLDEIARSRGLI